MAESIRGKEEGQVQCPLCPRAYKSGNVCKEHLYAKHQGHPNLAEVARSVPNDKCPYCHQPKANLVQHKRTCRARPEAQEDRAVQQPPPPLQVVEQQGSQELGQKIEEVHQQMQQVVQAVEGLQQQQRQQQQQHRPPHKYEGASNKEMVEHFKKRMRERQQNTENTVNMYSPVLEDFFKLEESRDPEFKAYRWWVWRKDYVPIRPVDEYLAVMLRDKGRKTGERICTVYKHLHTWIDEALNEAQTDPLSLHRQRASGPEEARSAIRRAGATNPGQGRKVARDAVEEHLDPSVLQEVLEVVLRNPLHEETMAKFAAGEWTHAGCNARKDCTDCRCRLKIKTLQDAQNFLAASIFIRNFGLRLRDVLNMTVGGLQEAVDALVVCPWCGSKVVYAKHKKTCRR